MNCIGCGVLLQNDDATKIGYTPKLNVKYCQRCFRIQHYDDLTISLKQGIDANEVIHKIQQLDALMVWIVDLFDFEANMLKNLNQYLQNKDVIFVGTKRDLLPYTLSDEKLSEFILKRLTKYKIQVKAIVVVGMLHQKLHSENQSIQNLVDAIEYYRDNKDVCVIGMANAGKSSLLNQLLSKQQLTTSRYPGTTIEVVKIPFDNYMIYDTPGISKQDTLLTHIEEEKLKQIVPVKPLHPTVFQLQKNQTLSIGGIVKLDLIGCENTTAVTYFKNELIIHRSKFENSQKLWETQLGKLLQPTLNDTIDEMKTLEFNNFKNKKYDIVIHGLGWICVSGKIAKIQVRIHPSVAVSIREGMI